MTEEETPFNKKLDDVMAVVGAAFICVIGGCVSALAIRFVVYAWSG